MINKKLLQTFILLFFSLIFVGPPSLLKADNSTDWLSGSWVGESQIGAIIEVEFKVVDQNLIKGSLLYKRGQVVSPATIIGTVRQDKLEFDAHHAGGVRKYQLSRKGEVLEGTMDTRDANTKYTIRFKKFQGK